jgi:PKD repeat protein
VAISAGGNVQFVNLSDGSVHTWLWDFGDGTSGPLNSEANPLKTYALAGTYTVSLTVTGDGGSDTETKTSYITVT